MCLKRLQLRAETAWPHFKSVKQTPEKRERNFPQDLAHTDGCGHSAKQRTGVDDGPTCEEKPPSRADWRAKSRLKWKWERKVDLKSRVRTVRSAGNKSRLVPISERSWELLRSADTRTETSEGLSAPQRARCWIKSILCFSSHRPAPVCVCVWYLQTTDWIHTGSGSWSRWRGFKSQYNYGSHHRGHMLVTHWPRFLATLYRNITISLFIMSTYKYFFL